MRIRLAAPLLCVAMLAQYVVAQAAPVQTAPAAAAQAKPAPAPYYFDPAVIDPSRILPPPPAPGSAAQAEDLAEVHNAHDHASPDVLKFAQRDANEQDLFIYATVLGPGFRADALPATADLSKHLMSDASVMNGLLKAIYLRPRPFRADTTLRSECGAATQMSYPSGHSMAGYLGAYTMAQIVPEKAQEILARADEYAQHRIVCAVHYPTDIREGRVVALELFGYLLAQPRFQKDLAAARSEVRVALHLDK
jgi:acid phosphatase (class A)